MEQDLIGQSHDTKLRLGLVNSRGQQKGVDSLIVTDLIELARNQAISDALILSGDEDIKIGVQIAQTFGVRVHLLGIKPARGSQSDSLMMEADTCHEWDETVVSQWMHCEDDAEDADGPPASAPTELGPTTGTAHRPDERPRNEPSAPHVFQRIVSSELDHTINALNALDLARHVEYLDANPGRLHYALDRPALARLRNRLGRDLSNQERKEYRQMFEAALRRAHAGTEPRTQ